MLGQSVLTVIEGTYPPHTLVGGGVQFLITFGTISYHCILLYSVLYFAVFWKVPKIRCILPYFESIEFGQI